MACPRVAWSSSGLDSRRALKKDRCSKLGPHILFHLLKTMLISEHVKRVNISRMPEEKNTQKKVSLFGFKYFCIFPLFQFYRLFQVYEVEFYSS